MQPVGILLQPSVADFRKAKDLLENQKGVLDTGSYLRLEPVPLFLSLAQWMVGLSLFVGKVLGVGCMAG